MLELDITVLRNGSVLRPVSMKPDYHYEKVVSSGMHNYSNVAFHDYSLPPLQSGDVVRISYSYKAPIAAWKHSVGRYDGTEFDSTIVRRPHINDNYLGSFRIFFHDKVSKYNVKVRIESPPNAPISFRYVNEAEPHRSYELDRTIDKWNYDYLPGALDEAGAYPHQELPHIEVLQGRPYGRYPEMMRQVDFKSDFIALHIGATIKPFSQIKHFVEQHTDTSIETLANMAALHNHIALNFDYDNGDKLFSNKHLNDTRIGTEIEKQVLHEASKYRIYRNLIHSYNLDQACAFVTDKRLGSISPHYYQSKYRDDFYFMASDNQNRTIYIWPKSARYGLLINEIPFYYEGARVQMVHTQFHGPVTKAIPFSGIKTQTFGHMPLSSQQDNTRSTNAQLTLVDGKAIIDFQISLSGQYSTLMRNLYMHQQVHPAVDAQYHRLWWEGHDVQAPEYQVQLIKPVFPYPSVVKGKLQSSLDAHGFELGSWLGHIVVDISSPRLLSYHPDFLGIDRFTLVINTGEKNIETLPPAIEVSNAFGSYVFQCSWAGPQSIKVQSVLSISSDAVRAEDIMQVIELYNAVKLAQATVLEFE